jgi:hypothetical protein
MLNYLFALSILLHMSNTDLACTLSCQEVRVRFSGFGPQEDEWINVQKCVRQRSVPCEATECVAVLPGDLILCFQVLSYSMFLLVIL